MLEAVDWKVVDPQIAGGCRNILEMAHFELKPVYTSASLGIDGHFLVGVLV